jgi:hypothetical protein
MVQCQSKRLRRLRELNLSRRHLETHRRPYPSPDLFSDRQKGAFWEDLYAVIAPHYPEGKNSSPPGRMEGMSRIRFLPP